MSNEMYRNSKGALYYLNLIYEGASPEIKTEIERAGERIQTMVDLFVSSPINLKNANYCSEEQTETELNRETMFVLRVLIENEGEDYEKLYKYVRLCLIKLKGREINDKHKRK